MYETLICYVCLTIYIYIYTLCHIWHEKMLTNIFNYEINYSK